MTERLSLTRLDDWPDLLAASVARQQDRPFAWGEHDCTTAWADNCAAMTGVDPMAEFRGRYSDDAGAKAALRIIGAGTLYHTMVAKFGPAVRPGAVRRGDPVFMMIPRMIDEAGVTVNGGPALMTCLGEMSVGPTRHGLSRIPTSHARWAWIVG